MFSFTSELEAEVDAVEIEAFEVDMVETFDIEVATFTEMHCCSVGVLTGALEEGVETKPDRKSVV